MKEAIVASASMLLLAFFHSPFQWAPNLNSLSNITPKVSIYALSTSSEPMVMLTGSLTLPSKLHLSRLLFIWFSSNRLNSI